MGRPGPLVRPFIPRMTALELHCLMVGHGHHCRERDGAYVSFLAGETWRTGKICQLFVCLIMNAPAAIVLAKVFMPEAEKEKSTNS